MSNQKYYVVEIGMRPGIYSSLSEARREGIVDHPNSRWRTFRSREDAIRFLADIVPQESINNQDHTNVTVAHTADTTASIGGVLPQDLRDADAANQPPFAHLAASDLSAPTPPPLSAPPPYTPNEPEPNTDLEIEQLASFLAAHRLTHASSIPPGREAEYQQDSILSSYYRPANTASESASDIQSQGSIVSGRTDSDIENGFPDREEDYNAVEDGSGSEPEIGAVPLFLGMQRCPHNNYYFRLRGAPDDHEVDVAAARAAVGQAANNYMTSHYFSKGSVHMVATFYQQYPDDRAAFGAALAPRGLASRVISYLWYLLHVEWPVWANPELSQVAGGMGGGVGTFVDEGRLEEGSLELGAGN